MARGRARARSRPTYQGDLEDGTRIRGRTVLCNADPKVALQLLEGQNISAHYRSRPEGWKMRNPVVRFNATLDALPDWTAAPGQSWPARATVNLTDGLEDAQRAFEACDRGEPAVGFGEIHADGGAGRPVTARHCSPVVPGTFGGWSSR